MTAVGTSGRVCVVTGGATGLGRGAVEALCRDGSTVVIADRDEVVGERTATELSGTGKAVRFWKVNVADEGGVRDFAAWLGREFGQVHTLVNNAGLGMREGSILEMSRKQWDLTIAVNLTGPFLMSRYIVPLMPAGSTVINVSGTAGLRAVAGTDAYCAAKGGVVALSKAMALSLAERDIRVNTVCPGIISSKEMASRYSEPVVQRMIDRAGPIRKEYGTIEEFGSVIAFLADPKAAAYINGTTITVDGGGIC